MMRRILPWGRSVAVVAAAALALPTAWTGSTDGTTNHSDAAARSTAAKAIVAVSLAAPASAPYSRQITMSGTLWRYGTTTRIGGALVWLQRTPHGRTSWANIANTRTSSAGGFTFRITQIAAYDYRAYYAGTATYTAARSPVRYPVVLQLVPFDVLMTADSTRGLVRAQGQVWPNPPTGTTVYLQRYDPAWRQWHSVGSGRTSGSKVVVTAARPGSVSTYRLVAPARASYGPGVSASRTLTHYVWRGFFARPVREIITNGAYEISWPPVSPDRSRAVVRSPWSFVEIDVPGCRAIRVKASRDAFGGGNVLLHVRHDAVMVREDHLGLSGSVDYVLALKANPSYPVVRYAVQQASAVSGYTITSNLYALCAN